MHIQLTTHQHKCLKITALTVFFIALIAQLLPLPEMPQYSTLILDNKQNVIHSFLSPDDKWRMPIQNQEITPQLTKALLFKEDRFFYQHFGINPLSILRAAYNNIRYQKRTSGASTLTMQIARMLQPKNRTYFNKITEILRAIQLELRYTKPQLLKLYLNLVPFGGNIEGIKSASILYFNKMPQQLSLAEITALVIIPNRPISLAIGKKNNNIIKTRNFWLNQFLKNQVFQANIIIDALDEPMKAERKNAPQIAPHLANKLKNTYPKQLIINTYINNEKQQSCQQIVSNYVNRLLPLNIKNAAAIVINNHNHHIEAYVGSANFLDNNDAGQVDGTQAIRSPGSALKPYLYALAFDNGLITPKYIITDVATNFGGYTPLNFDGTFNGAVTIEYALANSLNIPAVKILEKLGVPQFTKHLADAGFKDIKKRQNSLGLSTILGGCGVTLQELTHLYTAFALQGKQYPIHVTPNTKADTVSKQLFSAEAGFVIGKILSQLTRPDMPKNIENTLNLPRIAWKTGTSYGRKDAWSIGFNANYTIGVWVGNFSGKGVPELNGTATATPLLFQLFNAIDYNPFADAIKRPNNLDTRWVCAESGLPPNDFCTNRIFDDFLPLISSNEICQHLKTVYVSPDSLISYCTNCLPENGYKKKLYPNYPPELINYFEEQNISYQKVPAHNPNCERNLISGKLLITSPVNGIEYLIDTNDNKELLLKCMASNDIKNVYWYINKQFYKTTTPAQSIFFTPFEGVNTVACIDDKGRKEEVKFTVKFIY